MRTVKIRAEKPLPKKPFCLRIPSSLFYDLDVLCETTFDNRTDAIVHLVSKGLTKPHNSVNIKYYTLFRLVRISFRISKELMEEVEQFIEKMNSTSGKILTKTDAFLYLIDLGLS